MDYLPYSLPFCYRFNLHKLSGFLIDDSDWKTLAKIYGVSRKELRDVDRKFSGMLKETAERISADIPIKEGMEKISLLCIGDSITSDRLSYANIIREVWNQSLNREVIDAGISGDTTSDLINRHYSACLNFDFTAAAIFIGTNDARGHKDGKNITNTSVAEYERNLEYIMSTIAEQGKSIINITIPPVNNTKITAFFGDAENWNYDKDVIHEINNIIRKLSKKYRTELADLAGKCSKEEIEVLDEDGLHLCLKGNEITARLVLSIIDG